MFEFMSKALLALVLDKRAREALEAANGSALANSTKGANTAAPVPAKPPQSTATQVREMTDARRELIRSALAVQRSKQHVFDNLNEDDKAKLLIAAIKAMGIPPEEVGRSLLGRRKGNGPALKR